MNYFPPPPADWRPPAVDLSTLPDPATLTVYDFIYDADHPVHRRRPPPNMPSLLSDAWGVLFERFCEVTGYDPETDPEEVERSEACSRFLREL